jgi:DNA-binding transcriptional regulator GbsR (MarR family)
MAEISLAKYGPLIRFFEKEAEWLGLPRNRGIIFLTLYMNKYLNNEKLSVDQVCTITKYSRSNVGTILSQLEELGIVIGHPEIVTNGTRGRRKIVYSIDPNFDSLATLGFKRMIKNLEEFITTINALLKLYREETPQIRKMMKDIKTDMKKIHSVLSADINDI